MSHEKKKHDIFKDDLTYKEAEMFARAYLTGEGEEEYNLLNVQNLSEDTSNS